MRHSPRHLRAGAAVATVLALGVALAGCGGPSLTDPHEIVTRSLTAMADVKTFHFQVDAAGQLVVGVDEAPSEAPSGSGGATPVPSASAAAPGGSTSSAVSLEGATASGDVDLPAGAARVSGRLPGVPRIGGDVIVVGGVAYTRRTGEAGWHAADPSSLPFNPADPSAGPSILQAILSMAADSSFGTRLVGTENCPEGSCYHLALTISKDQASQQLGPGGLALGDGKMDLWILSDNFRVATAEFTSSDPTAGTFWGRVSLSRYNRGVQIQPPPADQVYPPGQ